MKEWAGRCVGKALAILHLCASEAIATGKRARISRSVNMQFVGLSVPVADHSLSSAEKYCSWSGSMSDLA